MFYAPWRGMSEVRDRSPLPAAMLLALLAQIGYVFYTQWQFLRPAFMLHGASLAFSLIFSVILPLLFIAVIFVPIMAFVANLFERRAQLWLDHPAGIRAAGRDHFLCVGGGQSRGTPAGLDSPCERL